MAKVSWRRQLWGTVGMCPLDFQQFNFSSSLYSCTKSDSLSKHILYFATASAVVQSRLYEPCSLFRIILCTTTKRFMQFCAPSHQILATPLCQNNVLHYVSLQRTWLSTAACECNNWPVKFGDRACIYAVRNLDGTYRRRRPVRRRGLLECFLTDGSASGRRRNLKSPINHNQEGGRARRGADWARQPE